MIKGQDRLYKIIDSYKKETLPHSMLLIGEQGSGKDEICKYIADKFDLQLYDLTEFISNEFISEINQTQTRSLYTVNMSDITVKDQNVLLKLYEEPNPSTYIIIKCINDFGAIDTIKSRSYTLKMSSFSKDILSEYIESEDKDLILSICTTPGQIEIANHTDMKGLYGLCYNMVTRMKDAPFFNLMSIANKINFSDEYDKYDLLLFVKMLSKICLEFNSIDLYLKVHDMNSLIWSMNSKKQYFENFLIKSWELVH